MKSAQQIVNQGIFDKGPQEFSQKETRKVGQQETLLVMLIGDNTKLARRL
jgi:hypothetical protein